ncbi:MAG: hypothetical protein HEP71_33245 [Roseivirga sp.]|nr:hypothetical protein [Roseivirga sp.]
MKLRLLLATVFFSLCSLSQAQEFPFGTDKWEINAAGHVVENYEGKRSLYLHQGRARLKDFEFYTGIIEYDVFVTERRGFPGIHFRIQDNQNFEEFYIRPHQSGNPDANQYTPVFNGNGAWQLYYGERFSTPYRYKVNAWNHIKLIVAEKRAEVYINDMDKPMLVIPELKREPKSGGLGFQSGGVSAFHLANLKVTKQTSPVLKGKIKPAPVLSQGVIENWSVSSPFAESSLQNVYELTAKQKNSLTWGLLGVEEKGYANLSRLASKTPQINTVFAKVVIQSDRKQVKKLSYGLSDRGVIYLNDQIVAGGQNNYGSQDYRHLGTIGFFDDVYLYLKKGKNELWIAVSENFGGWGIMASIEDREGIRIE